MESAKKYNLSYPEAPQYMSFYNLLQMGRFNPGKLLAVEFRNLYFSVQMEIGEISI
ncbi:hypothetical protein ACVWYG_002864 [Pedobacter sp. UYEF25]